MIPGIAVLAPKDEQELRDMLYTSVYDIDGPVAIRYPRGAALGVELEKGFKSIPVGKAETLEKGEDVALLAIGKMVEYSLEASQKLKEEGINAEVVNMRFIKPIDTSLLDDIAQRFDKVVTLEENSIVGGFGSAVLEYFSEKNYKNDLIRIGIPDQFIDHGTQTELHKLIGIDADGIFEKVKVFCKGRGVKEEATV
jgi:1-deoxy-D-xylulose-5-phosphate synthase